jgi:hypothetical protein
MRAPRPGGIIPLMKKSLCLPLLAAALIAPAGARGDTTDGSCMEEFVLYNFQPKSPTYQSTVSSRSYISRVTVFSLLASS